MKIILNPTPTKALDLRAAYRRAFASAEELYIASAYLTDWSTAPVLNPRCKNVLFLVGTDFGLTRKFAMHAVLKWIPKGIPFIF